MTDLKALRREMAKKVCGDPDGCYAMPTRDAIDAALLQYALACLGEPSRAMGQACELSHSDPEDYASNWTAMAAQRLKELE